MVGNHAAILIDPEEAGVDQVLDEIMVLLALADLGLLVEHLRLHLLNPLRHLAKLGLFLGSLLLVELKLQLGLSPLGVDPIGRKRELREALGTYLSRLAPVPFFWET